MKFTAGLRKFVTPPASIGFNQCVSVQDYFPTAVDLAAVGEAQKELHQRAAEARRSKFGRRVFVRAVMEVSNFCRENCAYCGMRRDNRGLKRFRAGHEQLAELLIHHRPASVTDVNIQAGEDPVAVRDVVLPLIRNVVPRNAARHQRVSRLTPGRTLRRDAIHRRGNLHHQI